MSGPSLAAGALALGVLGLAAWWLFRDPTPGEADEYAVAGAGQNPAPAAAWSPSIAVTVTPYLVPSAVAFAPRS